MNDTIKNPRASLTHPLTAIFCAVLIFISPARAGASAFGSFSNTYSDSGIDMILQGTGLKSVAFFKAFIAAFYQSESHYGDHLGELPKRIEVEYFIKIPGKKLNSFTVNSMKDNVTVGEFQSIIDKIELMERLFVDLKPGDKFSLTYIPGVGTKFAYNGEITGTIQGSEFARALFSVWIGEKPFDGRLKNKILGLENGRTSGQGKTDSPIDS